MQLVLLLPLLGLGALVVLLVHSVLEGPPGGLRIEALARLAGAGAGNWNPKPSTRGKTLSGEINHIYAAVLITINFRNPEDINSFEDGGMMKFDSNRVPFSGVYQVTTVVSTFKVFRKTFARIKRPCKLVGIS